MKGTGKRLLAMALSATIALTGIFATNLTVNADTCGGLEEKDVYMPASDEVVQDPVLHWAIRAAINSVAARPKLTKELLASRQLQDISYEQCAHPEDFVDWKMPYWIENLEGIQYATSARMIDICYTNATEGKRISDLSPLSELTQLKLLYLKQDGITDIDALKTLVNLEELNLYGNKEISDISAISDMSKLKKLTLEQNNVSGIDVVSGLTSLEYINIAYNKVTDLPDLSNLKSLYYLDANNNLLTNEDVKKIAEARALRELNLNGNTQITDIKPLARLIYLDKDKTFLPVSDEEKDDLFAAIEVNKLFNKFNISKMKASDSENVGKAIEAYDALTDEQKTYIESGRVEAARSNKQLVDDGLEPVYYPEYDEDGEAQPVLDRLEITVLDKKGNPIPNAVFVKHAMGIKEYTSDENGMFSVMHSASDAYWDLYIEPKDSNYIAIPEKITYEVKDGKTYTINGKRATGFEKLQFTLIPKDEYVDKSEVEKALASVESVEEEYKYTASSYTAYETARKEAEDVLGNADATQTEVDSAAAKLKSAIEGLKKTDILTTLKLNVKDQNGNVFTRPFKLRAYVPGTMAEPWNQLSDPYTGTIYLKTSPGWEDGKKWEINTCYEEPYSMTPIQVTIGVKDGQRYYKTVNGKAVDVDFEMDVIVVPGTATSNERQPDNTVLVEYIENAKTYQETDYTRLTFENLQEAISQAEAIASKNGATQEEYNAEAANLLAKEASLEKRADTLALEKEIAMWETYTKENYTTASWTAYEEKLDEAKMVYENENATQAQVDEALSALKEARNHLVLRANKTELGKKLNEAKAVKAEDYVGGYEALQAAIADAQVVYDDTESVKADVDAAIQKLQKAIDELEKKPTEINVSCDPSIFRAVVKDEEGTALTGVTFSVQYEGISGQDTITSNENGVLVYNLNGAYRGKKVTIQLSDDRYETEDVHWLETAGISDYIFNITSIDGQAYGYGQKTNLTYVLKKVIDQEALDREAAKTVDDKIAAIGTVTKESADAISEARKAYDALTDAQKQYVESYQVLLEAEETFEILISEVKVSKITITGLSKKIAAGKKVALKATVSPKNADNKTVRWKSSNTKIATVDRNGVVRLNKKSGGKTVTITAMATDGSNVTASYKITSAKGVVKSVKVTGAKPVKAGKSIQLKAKVTATKGANRKLVWKSSNTKYATVSSTGKVKTYSAGKRKKVKITAMATDGSGKKKTVTITIK